MRAIKFWESSCKERREGLSNCSPFFISFIAIEIISSVFYCCPRLLSHSSGLLVVLHKTWSQKFWDSPVEGRLVRRIVNQKCCKKIVVIEANSRKGAFVWVYLGQSFSVFPTLQSLFFLIYLYLPSFLGISSPRFFLHKLLFLRKKRNTSFFSLL